MVLSLMRRHAKSYLIKFMIALISIVFIFYFGYSFRAKEGTKVAYVNGELITGLEYNKAYRESLKALQKRYKGVWDDSLIKRFNLKQKVLDGLINQKLIAQEAKKLGLDVNKKEIQRAILSYPAFLNNGKFDERRYFALLRQNNMKPEDFESGIEQDLLEKKITQLLMSFLPITEKELREFYEYYNKKIKVSYVKFFSSSFKKDIKIEEEKLKEFFNKNKEDFRIPEKIKISFVEFDPEDFKKNITIPEDELRLYYEENIESFRVPKQIKARQIFLKVPETTTKEQEEKIKEKALGIAKRAKSGEDFSMLAKKYSEGPSAKKGGDIGYFSKGEMEKTIEDIAFQMKPGEISDPIRSSIGYHIIKVEDIKKARTKEFKEVRSEILETLLKMKSIDEAHERALLFIDQMPYDVDLKNYAKSHELEVKSTDFFSKEEPIPFIGNDYRLKDTLFSMGVKDTTDVIESNGKFYIIQVIDKKPSYLPKLSEVREAVESAYILHSAKERAKKKAREFLNKVRGGADWKKTAEEYRVRIKSTDFFSRNDPPFLELGFNERVYGELFSLNKNTPYPEDVFEDGDDLLVVKWEGEKVIDEKEFEKEKKDYQLRLLLLKQGEALNGWIKSLRKSAEIKIDPSFY